MKKIAIIQARMTSTRLPGKVLMEIAGKPMLWYVVKRTKWAKSLDDIIVAASTDISDDVIVDFCKKNKINYFRGSLNNVLGRYYYAAKKAKANIIVRITADCPLIDGYLIEKGIEKFKSENIDYLSNTLTRTFPRGFDFEIFTFDALKMAFENALEIPEREHVTPYIWHNNNGQFKLGKILNKNDKSHYRITVDTKEDFEVMKILIEKYHAAEKKFDELIQILDSHPEIVEINSDIKQMKYGQ